MEVELRINGVVASVQVAANESLLAMLRREGYCGVKQGCESGDCGACTVLVDGVARPSCVMLAGQVSGCTVTSVEGLSDEQRLHPLQQAFIEVGAVQCGFCTPGMLLSANALLKQNAMPSEEDVRDALSGNLCRCAGYSKAVQAVLRAAAVIRGESVEPPVQTIIKGEDANTYTTSATGSMGVVSAGSLVSATGKMRTITGNGASSTLHAMRPYLPLQVVGKALPRIDASKLAAGRPVFAGDHAPRGMLYGRILSSPHAHAIIRSIDVTEARALPGVHVVLTYQDVPRIPFSSVERLQEEEGPRDQYSLDSILRYAGDRVAAVAAETPEVAERALQLIRVEYDVLPPILDPRQALEPNAPQVHPESESYGIPDAYRNVAGRVRAERGDVEYGFAESDLVIENEYAVPQTQPVPLENHTVLTYFNEDETLVVRTSSQAPYHVRRTLARLVGLPERRIAVVQPEVGGDFGSKQVLMLEDLCALLTLASRRPVQLTYSRTEELRSGGIQHMHIVRIKSGVRRDGTLVANQIALLSSTGAYGTHPLTSKRDAGSDALLLYPCPHQRFLAEVLYTNLPPSAAFRGHGIPPEFFALESQMDEIAARLGIDALELRRKNWLKCGDSYPQLQETTWGREQADVPLVESCGLPDCARVVEEQLGWKEKRQGDAEGRYRRGIGLALALQRNDLQESDTSGAIIKLQEDGSFDVLVGVNGSGNSTLFAQIAAEVLGVPLEHLVVHDSNTSLTPTVTGSPAPTVLFTSANAVKRAAEQVRRQLLVVAGRMLNVLPDSLKIQQGIIDAAQGRTVSVAQVAAHALYVENRHIIASASWKGQQTPITFAAQGVEVEVDTETGALRVLKAISAVDTGKSINPLLDEGQIEGSATRALSAAIAEELLYDQQGGLLTATLSDYHIANARDLPHMQTYIVETNELAEPYGAKAVGQVPLLGMGPALANAVANATGIRMRQLPLTPEKLLRALYAQRAR